MAAIIPNTLLNAYLFFRFATRFDHRRAHLVGAVAFAFFGIDTLQATVSGVSVWETLVEHSVTAGSAVVVALIAGV